LKRKWENAKAYTLKMAALMPEEDYSFKPVPEEMSFREQLLHIAKNMQWLSSSYLLSENKIQIKDTAIKDKAAVLQVLSESYDMATLIHKKVPPKRLDDAVFFFAGAMTRRQILILMHDHQTHHAGQLIVYLRLKGIKPPEYVGW
jgi:uncharacterized damage-inducible protein DinB